ncbi:hypothetical protein HK101_011491, partial [Irineochytrium annulatum]
MACAEAVTFISVGPLDTRNVTLSCDQNFALAVKPGVVCPSVCNAYVSSIIAAINDPAAGCSGDFADFERQASGACTYLNSAKYDPNFATGKCFPGNAFESRTCGFANVADAQTYCKQNADSCCSFVPNAPVVAIPTTSSTPAAAAATSSTNSATITPATLGAITGVILALVLAVVVAVVYVIQRKHKRQLAITNATSKARIDRIEESLRESSTMPSTMDNRSGAHLLSVAGGNGQHSPNTLNNSAQSSISNSHLHPNGSNGSAQMQHMGSSTAASVVNSIPPSTHLTDATFSAVWTVITAYNPQMEDEVLLQPGEMVILETIYNDGWARGTNQTSNMFGYLPMACLEPVDQPAVSVFDPTN